MILSFDFVPHNDGKVGPPFFSQFAYVTFSGDMDAIHFGNLIKKVAEKVGGSGGGHSVASCKNG